ncbi:phytoene desaturase family protein [Rhodovibrionaceae bacterium A322]
MSKPVTTTHYDAVVIGGGHNGLVAAASLAKAGKTTLLLEASDQLGGMARGAELSENLSVSSALSVHSLSPQVIKDLGLEALGLRYRQTNLETLSLLPGGKTLRLNDSDPEASQKEISRFSVKDADRYPEFRARLLRLSAALAPFLDRSPAEIGADWDNRLEFLKLGWSIRKLGKKDMRELLRIIAMNAYDLVEDAFESPELKGALAFDAVLGTRFGPRSPNTVYTLLHRLAGEVAGQQGQRGWIEGGAAALIAVLEKAAHQAGAHIRCGTAVAEILVEDGQAKGVTLASGDSITCDLLLSSAHPKQTLMNLVPREHLDADFIHNVHHSKSQGITARLDLLLSGMPTVPEGTENSLANTRFVIAPDPAFLERAFDKAKYGEVPDAFGLEAFFTSRMEPGLAPAGKEVLSLTLQYTAHELRGHDWDRDALVKIVLGQLEDHMPGISGLVETHSLLLPEDYEATCGAPGGHWHHLELGLDQTYLLRPLPGWSQYRTPLKGLYLCGAGSHPGGGLTGRPGANAARQALKDLKG